MKTSLSILAALCLFAGASAVHAEDKPRSIAFRLTEWKSLHFEDAGEARQQVSTLKQLGCETQAEQHAGHLDVKFRAAKWTKVTLDSRAVADQWERWLKTTGFETLRGRDVAPPQGSISVHFRMPRGNRMHINDPAQAKEMVALLTGLGCSVQQDQHGGHIDLAIISPNWHNLICDSHDEAHAIQKWLDEQGFETRHDH